MSGAEHRRASAFIGGFKQLRLFHFSFINHASRTKFDHFVNFVSFIGGSILCDLRHKRPASEERFV